MADVFISYSRSDRPVAERLATALEAHGISVWMDSQLASGTTFTEVTEEELNKAGKVIVLWSETSIKSGWVKDEAQAAREQGKLAPFSIDGSQPPMGFRQIQTTDISAWANGHQAELPHGLLDGLGRPALTTDAQPTRSTPSPSPAPSKRKMIYAAVAALLVAIAGIAWFTLGGSDSSVLRSQERIPVLVRSFEASGSGEQGEAALASGITEELIVRLRRIEGLQIATALADGSSPSEAFAEAYVVEGSIRSSGEQLRVTARLVDADGGIIWSDTYDRKLVDLFDMQEEIAFNIANTLSVSLEVGKNTIEYGGTRNPEAFAAYMQWYINQRLFDRSIPQRYLEQAVALDPDYVDAQLALVNFYSLSASLSSSIKEGERLVELVDKGSRKALETNPDLPAAHVARMWYYAATKDLAGATREYQTLVALDRGDNFGVRGIQAWYLEALGRMREGSSVTKSTELIDPIHRNEPWQIFDAMMLGKYKESIDIFERIKDLPSVDAPTWVQHVFWAHVLSNGEAEAIAFANRNGQPRLGEQLKAAKDGRGLAGASGDQLLVWAQKNFDDTSQWSLTSAALFAGYAGHDSQAVELMRLAFERPGGVPLWLLWHPTMARARQTDAFEKLVTDMGFVAVWKDTGNWGDYCEPVTATEISCH